MKGTLLYQMGRTEEAVEELNHALLLNPNHHGARNNLHVIEYYRNKEWKTATTPAQQNVTITQAVVLYTLIYVYI